MRGAGNNFLLSNSNILNINSPTRNVTGPYAVVHTDQNDRWAIVALDWDNDPRLGIRWFWSKGGNPISSGHATWLIIPPLLSQSVLSNLPIVNQLANHVSDFLRGKISGEELRKLSPP